MNQIAQAGTAMSDAAMTASAAINGFLKALDGVDVKGPDDHVAEAIMWLKSMPIDEGSIAAAVRDTALRKLNWALYKFDHPDN